VHYVWGNACFVACVKHPVLDDLQKSEYLIVTEFLQWLTKITVSFVFPNNEKQRLIARVMSLASKDF